MADEKDGIGSLLKDHTIAVLLFAAATASVFVTAYHVASFCFRNRRRQSPLRVATAEPRPGSTERIHLEAELIDIPAHKYRRKGGDDVAVCAVCLGEFEEGEELRALPGCKHAFHAACIDMWLCSHLTCPICRAHTSTPPPETSLDLADLDHRVAP